MASRILLGVFLCAAIASTAPAQELSAPPPAYLAVVEGNATLLREGEAIAAEPNMPFVQGDRLRTADGRVQIVFPDGTAIEVGENSEVECISPSRVRLLAGTMDHVQRAIGGGESAAHLPPELNVYGNTFDQNGAWQYDPPYGYVWYPTVAADWRPYYNGYWATVPTYGYTWIGLDVWSWPTHHYGRWGFARNRWFWIPGRTWGPAWVSWASAPGYVSWCPLGFDGRPVFAFYGFGRSFAGWTILPRANFGARRYYANRYFVDPRRLPPSATFIAHNAPPRADRVGRVNVTNVPTTGVAVPRRQPPVVGPPPTSAGTRPVVAGTPQSTPAGSRQSPVGTPVAPGVNGTQGNSLGSPTPTIVRPNVPTHYGIAPRPVAPAVVGSPTPTPVTPAQPTIGRTGGPPPIAPVGYTRSAPTIVGPSMIGPAQPGPAAAPTPAATPPSRPAPSAAPQGEGRPRGEGRTQGEERSQGGEGRSRGGEGRARGGRGG